MKELGTIPGWEDCFPEARLILDCASGAVFAAEDGDRFFRILDKHRKPSHPVRTAVTAETALIPLPSETERALELASRLARGSRGASSPAAHVGRSGRATPSARLKGQPNTPQGRRDALQCLPRVREPGAAVGVAGLSAHDVRHA